MTDNDHTDKWHYDRFDGIIYQLNRCDRLADQLAFGEYNKDTVKEILNQATQALDELTYLVSDLTKEAESNESK